MDALKIHTAANVDIDYRLASLSSRIWATVIDMLVISVVCILFVVAFYWLGDSWKINKYGDIVFFIFVSFFYMFYHLVSEMAMNGQSIGKRAMKIRVVSLDGNQATFRQYLIRWLFRAVDMGMSRGACAVLMYLMNDKHQRLGDYLAKTVVIADKEKNGITGEQLMAAFAPEPDKDREPEKLQYPEAKKLSREDVALIRAAIRQSENTMNPMLLVVLADKMEQKLQIKRGTLTPILFLQQLLKEHLL